MLPADISFSQCFSTGCPRSTVDPQVLVTIAIGLSNLLQTERLLSCASIARAIALMMEAASTSETSITFYQTTWRNNPEDSHLCTRRRENLKSDENIALLQLAIFV
jgi:hypothetical protein